MNLLSPCMHWHTLSNDQAKKIECPESLLKLNDSQRLIFLFDSETHLTIIMMLNFKLICGMWCHKVNNNSILIGLATKFGRDILATLGLSVSHTWAQMRAQISNNG